MCEHYVIYMEIMHNACPGDTQVMYVNLNWNSGPSIKPSFHNAPLASRDLTRRWRVPTYRNGSSRRFNHLWKSLTPVFSLCIWKQCVWTFRTSVWIVSYNKWHEKNGEFGENLVNGLTIKMWAVIRTGSKRWWRNPEPVPDGRGFSRINPGGTKVKPERAVWSCRCQGMALIRETASLRGCWGHGHLTQGLFYLERLQLSAKDKVNRAPGRKESHFCSLSSCAPRPQSSGDRERDWMWRDGPKVSRHSHLQPINHSS